MIRFHLCAFNKDKEQHVMTVRKPEKITNVKQIIDDCHLVITITGTDEDAPAYYLYKEMTTRNIGRILKET